MTIATYWGRYGFYCALFAVSFISSIGCTNSSGGDSRPQVLCTTTLIADTTRAVGGEWIRVETLMGPGVDPHRYQPTAADSAKLRQAQLIFHNGLHLEGKMTSVLEKSGAKAVAVTGAIPRELLRPADENHDGSYDPHVWMDVRLWMRVVECIRDELCRFDPVHAEYYRTNASSYLDELVALDSEVHALARNLRRERRILVTSHDAFGYFGRAYDFEVHGLQGVSTASEVDTVQRDALAKLLIEKQVPAVFTETSVPAEGLKAVLETVKKASGREVKLVGGEKSLYSDSLGPTGSPGSTYVGMIRHNMSTIVEALSR